MMYFNVEGGISYSIVNSRVLPFEGAQFRAMDGIVIPWYTVKDFFFHHMLILVRGDIVRIHIQPTLTQYPSTPSQDVQNMAPCTFTIGVLKLSSSCSHSGEDAFILAIILMLLG